jgi:hypothetical protein
MHIKLDEIALQKIYDNALYLVKTTTNTALDSHVFPISCTLIAFENYVQSLGMPLNLEQPKPRDWHSGAID